MGSQVNFNLPEGADQVYEGQNTLIAGNAMVINLKTRAGRMAARAYAMTQRVDADNEEDGDRLYAEIMNIVGKDEANVG